MGDALGIAAATSGMADARAIALPRITYRRRSELTVWIRAEMDDAVSVRPGPQGCECQLFNRCRTLDTNPRAGATRSPRRFGTRKSGEAKGAENSGHRFARLTCLGSSAQWNLESSRSDLVVICPGKLDQVPVVAERMEIVVSYTTRRPATSSRRERRHRASPRRTCSADDVRNRRASRVRIHRPSGSKR